jgi:hypothetical protein
MVCDFLDKNNICKIKFRICNVKEENINKCSVHKNLKENPPSYNLYEVRKDAVCLNCGHKGAIQSNLSSLSHAIHN